MSNKIDQSAEDLKHIRKMMEQSNKFLSLSGLSGIFAGIVALSGVFIANKMLHNFAADWYGNYSRGILDEKIEQLETRLVILCCAVLLLALGLGFIFTYLKAKKNKAKLYNKTSIRVAFALFTPLAFGGLFTIMLASNGLYQFAGAATLMFYGMALLNASKHLNIEIKYLAISEMILGLVAGLFLDNVMIIWAIGFGILHILYGSIMYIKYDRNK